jgi:hypothetical protein
LPLLALALLAVSLDAAEPAVPVAGPRIAVDPLGFDFGKALPNRTLKKEFVVRNIGTQDLVIDRITTSCGCAAALLDDKRVKPGKAATLRVELQTLASPGRVERKILVRSNDEAHDPLELKVQVSVVLQ